MQTVIDFRRRPMRGLMLFGLLVALPGVLTNDSRAQEGAEAADAATIADPLFQVEHSRTRMGIVEKFAKLVELPNRIARVDGFDPDVISVTGVQGHPNRVRVFAVTPGVTTMVLTDEKDATFNVDVFVSGDVRHLQAYLDRMFPEAAIDAIEVRDSVVLRGWVTQPEHLTSIVEIAEQFYPRVLNQLQVGGAQQVLLKVKVMEVQRSKMRKLGFNFLYLDQSGYLASTPGKLTPLAGITAPFGGPPGLAVNAQSVGNSTLAFGLVKDDSIFQGFLEALKQEALLKILAEPELTTTNGRPANMLAGGEFPILVPQSLGTVTIEWREFGVRLEAVPHILGRGRVRLELQPEVSDRDFTNSVSINGQTVPGLTTRRVNTQVTMNFGETYILAGLLSMRDTAETFKVPLLGELPWLGAAFRRVSYTENETELVIMVTPELAAPLKPGEVPCGGPGQFTTVPLDRELYRDGMLEVPNYGDACEGCRTGTDGGLIYGGQSMEPAPYGLPEPAPSEGIPPHYDSTTPMIPPVPAPGASRQRPSGVLPAGASGTGQKGLITPTSGRSGSSPAAANARPSQSSSVTRPPSRGATAPTSAVEPPSRFARLRNIFGSRDAVDSEPKEPKYDATFRR